MSRRKFIAGNWKMFTAANLARTLTSDVGRQAEALTEQVDIAICPPFPWLAVVGDVLQKANSKVALGAQNLYPAKEGAFTGEVSSEMLLDVGCKYVIVGHSERRQHFGEADAFINEKVKFATAAGLHVILCIGETLTEREEDLTEYTLDRQVTAGLEGLADLSKITIAYEPVWAIGTGKTATTEQAQAAHAFIRGRVAELYSAGAAQQLIIQYGGSVKPDNAAALLSQPDVDGALVGGASLKADTFLAIIKAAVR